MQHKWRIFPAVLAACVAAPMSINVRAATPEEIEQSIQQGLAWLAMMQQPDGSWDEYGCDRVAYTGLVVLKMADRAREQGFDPFDPAYEYAGHVMTGLEFIAAHRIAVDITSEPLADGDGDGMGVMFDDCGWHPNYNTGIAMMALSASGHPELYGDLMQDALDWMAFAQNNPGCEPHRGGWGYEPNFCWADNSNSGYSSLGVGYAVAAPPNGFGLTMPAFVPTELSLWLDEIQNANGGSDYSAGDNWHNVLKTGNLLYELALVGDPLDSPRVQAAIAYIQNNWLQPPCDGWIDNPQGAFTLMKGLEAYNITLLDLDADNIPEHDWFDEVSTHLVATQMPGGAWFGGCWAGEILDTAWALLMLERVVAPPPSFDGRMTGGGSVFTDGVRYTHGFTLHCDLEDGPDNLEINWGKGNKFHLESLDAARCFDDPDIDEEHPVAGIDTLTGSGVGRLNGVPGATIRFIFTDAGEPGKGVDYAEFTISDGVSTVTVVGTLDKGNHQAHPE